MRRMINRYRESVCSSCEKEGSGRNRALAPRECAGDKSEEIERKPIHCRMRLSRLDQPPPPPLSLSLEQCFLFPSPVTTCSRGRFCSLKTLNLPLKGCAAGYLLKRQKDWEERGLWERVELSSELLNVEKRLSAMRPELGHFWNATQLRNIMHTNIFVELSLNIEVNTKHLEGHFKCVFWDRGNLCSQVTC